MVFLFGGRPKTNTEYIEAEKKFDEAKRRKFLESKTKEAEESTENKRSFVDRAKNTVDYARTKYRTHKLKRYKKKKEREQHKEERNFRVVQASEINAFGRDLSNRERQDYEIQGEIDRARRKQKIQNFRSTMGVIDSKARDVGNRVNAFDEKLAAVNPFDINIVDDQYSNTTPAYSDTLGEFFNVSPPRSNGGRSKTSGLESMFSIGSGKSADLSIFAIGTPKGRGKSTKQPDLGAMFSISSSNGGKARRRKKDPWSFF